MTVWAVKYVATVRDVFKVYLFKERDDATELFEHVAGKFRETLKDVDGATGNIVADEPGCFHWRGYSGGTIKVTLGEEVII